MKVLFTHPYFLALDPKQAKAARPYPPLGTLYAAAAVRAAGHDVAFHDTFFAPGASSLDAPLARARPDVVVIYDDGFNWLTKMCLSVMEAEALAMVRSSRAAGATVVVSGSDASDHRRRYLEAGASFVLLGDGEPTLVELLAALESGADPSGIAGLARLDGQALVETGRRRSPSDLDTLPRPAWDLLDFAPYERTWRSRHGRFSLNLVSSRGCPYGCAWCAKPLFGRQYFVHSPGRVAADLEALSSHARFDHVWFGDDIFGLTAAWTGGLADALEAAGRRVPFTIQTRADLVLDDALRANLVRAGLETAWLGAESGSQKVLDAMNKGLRVEETREAVRALKAAGVRVGLFLQYGYLGETREDVEKTLAMVLDLLPDEIGVSVSYPLPGTPFFEQVKAALGEKTNWVDSDDLDPMVPGAFSPAFYRRLHRYTHRLFQAHRGLANARRVLARPARATREQVRSAVATLVHLPASVAEGLLYRRLARSERRTAGS
ncbi:MAG: radical SAM protein [Thermoanaerobaculia bacterium]